MIDEGWLRSLVFTGVHGLEFDGYCEIGSSKVVFRATGPDGKWLAVHVPKNRLGLHIREVPLFLSGTPLYQLETLNQKLLSLVGDPCLDTMSHEYDHLYGAMIEALYRMTSQHPVECWSLQLEALGALLCPAWPETLRFILSTNAMRRRLEDIAALPVPDPKGLHDVKDLTQLAEHFVLINADTFPLRDLRSRLAEWARQLLGVLPLIADTQTKPETLAANPVYVWSAAAMDGFFTNEELPEVVTFIERHFGHLPSRDDSTILLEQAHALCHLMACVLPRSDAAGLYSLCARLGFRFDVYNHKGGVVFRGLGRTPD